MTLCQYAVAHPSAQVITDVPISSRRTAIKPPYTRCTSRYIKLWSEKSLIHLSFAAALAGVDSAAHVDFRFAARRAAEHFGLEMIRDWNECPQII